MAKRRNAPALFELLRDSNSTRTGQIGGEQLRTQLGGGTVKNTAPRPPGHPSLKATEPPPEPTAPGATPVTPIGAQVASDSLVESKQPAELGPVAKGTEVDPLLAMPTFRAGRPVKEKPEPKAEPKAEPRSEPTAQPLSSTQASALVPPKTPRPTRIEPTRPEPTRVEVAPPPKPESPKVSPKPAYQPTPTPSGFEPESEEGSSDWEQVAPVERLPLLKRVGNQLTFSTPVVGMALASVLVIVVISYVVGTLIGRKQASDELAPQLQHQADSTLSGLEGQERPGRTVEDRPIDPMNLAKDPVANKPIAVQTPPVQAQTPTTTPVPAPEETKPVQITNADTRVIGQNYLHLAPLADPEEARRLQTFLAENGIESFVREQYRGGLLGHEIITLVGIPSEGWSTNTRKIDHAEEIKRLGGIWFREYGGSIDFSRENQSQWYNRKE